MKSKITFVALLLVAAANCLPLSEKSSAEKARYLMSKTEWLSIATISTIDDIKGSPFVNVKSTSDGNSGIPYMLLTDMDLSVIDLNADKRASVLTTFADGECKEAGLDAQDPRCPRLILSGTFEKVSDEEEQKFARKALIEKHPIMKEWEKIHDFYIGKLNVDKVIYLGAFGGAEHIKVDDYLGANVV